MKRQWKRTLSVLLSVAMLFSMTGMNTVFALEGGPVIGASGLCEHHKEHTVDCGYTEGTPEVPCAHEHTDECYKEVTECIHEHTDECYPAEDSVSDNDATPSDAEQREPTECTHMCSAENGCITTELDCRHEHDEDCGYAPAVPGTPCAFVCEECAKDSGGQNTPPAANGLVPTITGFGVAPPDGSYTITVKTVGNGTASVSQASAAEGTKITVTATPDDSSVCWPIISMTYGDTQVSLGFATTKSFAMPAANVTVSVNFPEHTLPDKWGSGNALYCQKVCSVCQSGVSQGPHTYDDSTDLACNRCGYTRSTYKITVESEGNGTASASHASATAGTEITLTAMPDSGYQFKKWHFPRWEPSSVTDNKFTMGENNVKVVAIFEAIPTYAVTTTIDCTTGDPATAYDGTNGVKWEGTSKTLTLTDVAVNVTSGHAINLPDGATVHGVGEVSIATSDSNGNGINSAGSVTVTGDIESISGSSNGIDARKDITISGKVGSITAGHTALYSGGYGIPNDSRKITLSGEIGTISGSYGISDGATPGCSVHIEKTATLGTITATNDTTIYAHSPGVIRIAAPCTLIAPSNGSVFSSSGPAPEIVPPMYIKTWSKNAGGTPAEGSGTNWWQAARYVQIGNACDNDKHGGWEPCTSCGSGETHGGTVPAGSLHHVCGYCGNAYSQCRDTNSSGTCDGCYRSMDGTPAPTITGVTVNPVATSVCKKAPEPFTATVTGTGNFDDTVTWTVEGGVGGTTMYSNGTTGTLYVHENETAATLTVRATSTMDHTKSGTATVTVVDTGLHHSLLTVVGGTGSGTYVQGATVTITANAPAAGKVFEKWTITSGGGTLADANSATTTYTMPANAATVTATYKDAPTGSHTITASAGTGGSISPSGTITVNSGESKTFTISANSNYSISSVLVDGVNQGAISSYTFHNATGNHTISATFRYNGGGGGGGGSGGGGGGSSSSGGSSGGGSNPAADRPSSNVDSAGGVKPADVTADTAKAIAEAVKAGGAPRANVLVENARSVSPQTLRDMATAAQKAGGSAQLMADSTVDGKIVARVYLEAARAANLQNDILLGVSVAEKDTKATKDTYEKFFENDDLMVISMAHQGPIGMRVQVAVKVDLETFDSKNLYFYAYDTKTNTYYPIANPAYRVDQNGWLYFHTERGGDILITGKPLARKV